MKTKVRRSHRKKHRVSGFRKRMRTAGGRKILARRRRRGRPLTTI